MAVFSYFNSSISDLAVIIKYWNYFVLQVPVITNTSDTFLSSLYTGFIVLQISTCAHL